MFVSVGTYECIRQLFELTSNVCCTYIAPQHCIYTHQDTRTYMYRQTDRHSGWMSDIVAAHTLAHVVHTRTPFNGDAAELRWAHACTRACACMCADLFPFLSLKTQSDVCFTNVHERICFLFVHFYEHARQLSAHARAHMQRSLGHP